MLLILVMTWAPLLVGHSCVAAGTIANRLIHEGAKLPAYYVEIGALALFLYLLALGPLCLFTRSLVRSIIPFPFGRSSLVGLAATGVSNPPGDAIPLRVSQHPPEPHDAYIAIPVTTRTTPATIAAITAGCKPFLSMLATSE
jgi:hypothetical protein